MVYCMFNSIYLIFTLLSGCTCKFQKSIYTHTTYNVNNNNRKYNVEQWYGMVWYGNSLFDITEKYVVIAKYLIKYMIYVWRLHKEYTGCSLPCSHQGKC